MDMTYVAMLRGFGPTKPNMRNEKLRMVFRGLSYTNVKTVIASGNVIFDCPNTRPDTLEREIEKAIARKLGFTSTVIIRRKSDIEKLIASDPFAHLKKPADPYLLVTFMRQPPYEAFTVLDRSDPSTPDEMRKLEKAYGKDITSRTWQTISRILKATEKE